MCVISTIVKCKVGDNSSDLNNNCCNGMPNCCHSKIHLALLSCRVEFVMFSERYLDDNKEFDRHI